MGGPAPRTHPADARTHLVPRRTSRTRGRAPSTRTPPRGRGAAPCGGTRGAAEGRAPEFSSLRSGRGPLFRPQLHRFPSEARGRGLEKLDFARARAPRAVIGIFSGLFFSSSNDTQTTYRSRPSKVGLSVIPIDFPFWGGKSLVLRRGRVISSFVIGILFFFVTYRMKHLRLTSI